MLATAAIADRLTAVRERTLALVEPLADDALGRRPSPLMSPPLWDLGHIGAYEELWVARRVGGRRALHPDLDSLYDAFETPRAARSDLPILGPEECRGYLRRVRAATLEVLRRTGLDPDGPPLTADGFVFELVAEHEAQHTETMLQTFQLMPGGGYVPERVPLPAAAAPVRHDAVEIPPGPAWTGAAARGFAYDCERPRHRCELPGFRLARHPVTNGAHLAFMADGGYRRPELWSGEGWAWREREGVTAPLYWEPDGEGGRLARSFERVGAVDPDLPLCHVSYFEAEAHARWAGGRLPSEHEWERAATHGRSEEPPPTYPWGDDDVDGRATLGQRTAGPAPVGARPDGAAASGVEGMIGDVWEWTSSGFQGYPGFRAFPYREYAEVFFGSGCRVLRGGSWATQGVAARTTFRNWDLPERRQIFAGLRVAWDA
jgi:iron(II)-dependent oxidoreductase